MSSYYFTNNIIMDFEKIAQSALDAPSRAQQKRTELVQLLELLSHLSPREILEIGVLKGGTIKAWTNIAKDDATIIGIDLPGGSYGGGFTETESQNIKSLARNEQQINLFAVDSHDQTTLDNIVKPYSDKVGGIDFLFIDADHTYEGAKIDFEMYSPLVKVGGIIALHDIVKHTHYPEVEVYKLWEEIKTDYPEYKIKEFIDLDYPTDHGYWGGIGVIIV